MMIKLLSATLILFSTSSCATLFTGTRDSIHFNSSPPGATIYMNGLEVGTTPTILPVKRSLTTPYMTLKKEGFEDNNFQLQNTFNFVSLLDIFFPITFIVDAATGSIMQYDLKGYNINLRPVNK